MRIWLQTWVVFWWWHCQKDRISSIPCVAWDDRPRLVLALVDIPTDLKTKQKFHQQIFKSIQQTSRHPLHSRYYLRLRKWILQDFAKTRERDAVHAFSCSISIAEIQLRSLRLWIPTLSYYICIYNFYYYAVWLRAIYTKYFKRFFLHFLRV